MYNIDTNLNDYKLKLNLKKKNHCACDICVAEIGSEKKKKKFSYAEYVNILQMTCARN